MTRPVKLSKSHKIKDGKVIKTNATRSVSEKIRQRKSKRVRPVRKTPC